VDNPGAALLAGGLIALTVILAGRRALRLIAVLAVIALIVLVATGRLSFTATIADWLRL
jgi:hypothetical protein